MSRVCAALVLLAGLGRAVDEIGLCPTARGLLFAGPPSDRPLRLAGNSSRCLGYAPGCAGHGCAVEADCVGAPSWSTAPAPGGDGVLIRAGGICLDYNRALKRLQAFDCGKSPAYKNQHFAVDTTANGTLIRTTMPGYGDSDSVCVRAAPPPPPPPVSAAACPQYHAGRGQYDPSGVIQQPDGTWHMFPDGGHWGHCTSPDLLHWNCSHPSTGFDGDTGSITVTPKGTFAMWPAKGIEMAVPTGPDLDVWIKKGTVGTGGERDPGRAIQLKSGWYVPEGVTGIHWFKDLSNGSMTSLKLTGALLSQGTDGITEFECPDVFELDGKIVALTSTQGLNGWTQFWVGEMSPDDLKLIPDYTDRLDHGATGISTIYAAKTGTSALPPFNRRVLLGFAGWSERKVTQCSNWYVLPRDLSLSPQGKLVQTPAREVVSLRRQQVAFPSLATGSQIELLVRCAIPAAVPTTGVLGLRTLLAAGANQSVEVGYDFGQMDGFSSVSASLSTLGARRDSVPLPELKSSPWVELRIFVDGHMVETFFGGAAVITTITGNVIPSVNISSSFVNTANLECNNIISWVLGL